jgi:hypothetical protein
MKLSFLFLTISLLFSQVVGDCYLQYPPGSNDRLNEANTDRNNANRLFDSQNNAQGGYCISQNDMRLNFYEGSLLTIEWTNQHGCSNPNLNCNFVIQYMCSTRQVANGTSDPYTTIRDGYTDNTNPNTDTISQATVNSTTNGYFTYGQHETWDYYNACATRFRNYGLFTADRVGQGLNAQGDTAIQTRQNNNGERYGFECQEERDYYPYWHPSPWKDIAVLVDDKIQSVVCSIVKQNSQNVASKGYCVTDTNSMNPAQENNQVDCNTNGHVWQTQKSWGLPPPECISAPFTRDNHLGNNPSGYMNNYNWTLPTSDVEPCIGTNNCACVLRIRYNISSADYDGWGQNFLDWKANGDNSPVQENPYVPLVLTNSENTYNDQTITDPSNPPQPGQYFYFQLALDTTQFGRTFQDRSHVFYIQPRPSSIPSFARIYNLGVRGKRGNIVEVYPAIEYDFTPNSLAILPEDYIHIQWIGCDQNPAGNAGEGTDQTDRHNMVQIEGPSHSYPASQSWLNSNVQLFPDSSTRLGMAYVGQPITDPTQCLSYQQLLANNGNNQDQADQDPRNCMELNAAPPYYDGGAIQFKNIGTFYYMGTRNNSFSNRTQKGTIFVNNILSVGLIVVVALGLTVFAGAAGVSVISFYSRNHPHSSIAQTFSRIASKF